MIGSGLRHDEILAISEETSRESIRQRNGYLKNDAQMELPSKEKNTNRMDIISVSFMAGLKCEGLN